MKDLLLRTGFLAIISYLLPLLLYGMIRGREKRDPLIRRFFIYLWASFIFALINYFTGIFHINNLWIYTIQFTTEYYLLSWIFKDLLETKPLRRFIIIMMLVYAGVLAVNAKRILSFNTFDSYDAAFVCFVIIIYALLFFHRQLNKPQIVFIYKSPWFWFVTGLLLFYAGSFFIFLTTNYIMRWDTPFSHGLWNLKDILDILKNVLVTIGLLYLSKKQVWKSF